MTKYIVPYAHYFYNALVLVEVKLYYFIMNSCPTSPNRFGSVSLTVYTCFAEVYLDG
jgi:hypothetical protein